MRESRQTKHMNPRVWPAPPRVPQPTRPTVPCLGGTLRPLVFLGAQNTMRTLLHVSLGLPWGQGYVSWLIWFWAQTQNCLALPLQVFAIPPWAETHPHPHIQQPQALMATFTSCRSWWDNWLWGSLSFWVIHGCCRTCLAVRRWWGSTCSILDTKSWRHSGQGGDGWGTEEADSCAPLSAALIAKDWKAIASSHLWSAPLQKPPQTGSGGAPF